jgi:hypothetical protein
VTIPAQSPQAYPVYPTPKPAPEKGTIAKAFDWWEQLAPDVKPALITIYFGGIMISVWHGQVRGNSVLSGLAWGTAAAVLPVIVPAIATAQGLAEPKKRGRKRRR